MNFEGYVLEIIKKIEEKGYEAFLVGRSVLLNIIEKPIEEYDIITSAPLFFIYNGIQDQNRIRIKLFQKPVTIHFKTDFDSYQKQCSFTIEALSYHPRHGILGGKTALEDVEKRRIRLLAPLTEEIYLKALCYHYGLGFSLYFQVKKEQFLKPTLHPNILAKYLKILLALDQPGQIFLEHTAFFSQYFLCGDTLRILDFLKQSLPLRILAFLSFQQDKEKWLSILEIQKDQRDILLQALELLQLPCDEFILKQQDLELWFPYKRALALYHKDFILLKEIDRIQESYIQRKRKKQILDLTEADIAEYDISPKDMDSILKELYQRVLRKEVENRKEELLKEIYKIKQNL